MRPKLSVVIATYNSQEHLARIFPALESQTIAKELMEILIIDGGSSDETIKMAKAFGAIVFNNSYKDPVHAKYLGFVKARGDYLIYLDHDEVLLNTFSFEVRYNFLNRNNEINMAFTGGYANPIGYPSINEFINAYGDPFSAYFYNLSKDHKVFLSQLKSKYKYVGLVDKLDVFEFHLDNDLGIFEVCAAGTMIRKKYFQQFFTNIEDDFKLIPHLFYLSEVRVIQFGILNNDVIEHYSAESVKKYLMKIRWRVINNIFNQGGIGDSGFRGRSTFNTKTLRKFWYIPFNFLIIPLLTSSLLKVINHKTIRMFAFIPLSLYTVVLILWFQLLKLNNISPKFLNYDGTST